MSAKTTIWLSPQNRVCVACASLKLQRSFTRNRRALRFEASYHVEYDSSLRSCIRCIPGKCVRVNKTYLQNQDERYGLQTVLEQAMWQEPLVQDIYFDSLSLMKCTLSTWVSKCTCVISRERTSLLNSRSILGREGSQIPHLLDNP